MSHPFALPTVTYIGLVNPAFLYQPGNPIKAIQFLDTFNKIMVQLAELGIIALVVVSSIIFQFICLFAVGYHVHLPLFSRHFTANTMSCNFYAFSRSADVGSQLIADEAYLNQ